MRRTLAAWIGRVMVGLVLLLGSACPGGGGAADAALDGGDAQQDGAVESPLRIGSSYTLELATWNIRNFPTDNDTVDRVAILLATMDLDFVAVQEVGDVDAWQAMVDGLNALCPYPYETILSPDAYYPGSYQKTGFLWRTDMIELLDATSLFPEDSYAFPRPPLQARFEVAHPGGWTLDFAAIVVHLKASVDWESEQRRAAGIRRLVEYADAFTGYDGVSTPVESELILLGDFNDRIDDPVEYNVFGPLLNAPDHYQPLTRQLVEEGGYTVLPWQGFIDHIFITADLQYEYAGGRTEVVSLERAEELYDTSLGYDYTDAISDHLPVVAILPWVDY